MLEQSDLALSLTPAAREKIANKLGEPGFEGKIPALMLELSRPDALTWRITYYERDSVGTAEFKALLLHCNGIELIVPQWNFAEAIDGGLLDWTGSAYTINGKMELEIKRVPK